MRICNSTNVARKILVGYLIHLAIFLSNTSNFQVANGLCSVYNELEAYLHNIYTNDRACYARGFIGDRYVTYYLHTIQNGPE